MHWTNSRPEHSQIKLIPKSLQKKMPIAYEVREARKSLAYWWYRCLALNDGYINCCEAEGIGPFAELYADMGDVRRPFSNWWTQYGRKAFMEQEPLKDVIKLQRNGQAHEHLERADVLVLSIPLTMRKTTAMRKIGKKLAEAQEQRPPIDIWKASTAKRMIVKNKVRQSTIEQLLRVWELRQTNPDDSLYVLGRKAGIELDLLARSTAGEILTEDMERRRLTIAVSRMLKQARHMIDNAGQGVFPSIKPPAQATMSG